MDDKLAEKKNEIKETAQYHLGFGIWPEASIYLRNAECSRL